MKKGLVFVWLVFILLAGCKIQQYIDQLQTEAIDYRGYKIFSISEGSKAIVISTGEGSKQLRIAEMHQSSKDTAVTIAETEDHSNDKNTYIVVGIEEIVGAFFVFERDELQEIMD